MNEKKVALLIMDGWGLGKINKSDAIQHAHVPFVQSLYQQYPNTTLVTCGEAVGLPDGQMGNSEVGHLNLGAGRIVYQELQRINVSIRNQELEKNPVLINALDYAHKEGKTIHLIGLVSDGGVHAHLDHLKALLTILKKSSAKRVLVHAFTDGRDTDPKSGVGFIRSLQKHLKTTGGELASVTGRYYAMDRDKRWERVKLAYDALVNGKGELSEDFISSLEQNYREGITDEFLKPMLNKHIENSAIQSGDVVICFNFRTDRCREITEVLTQHAVPEYNMQPLALHYITMTQYDPNFKNVSVLYENDDLKNTLGEVLSAHGKTQLRMAETEKYPHVTFFFNGGREKPFEGEERIMVPSPKVATYDLQPEMSALELTDAAIKDIDTSHPDFLCLNYANADMVGHTGVWNAVIKAVETVDQCVEKLVAVLLKNGYSIFLTADHGNADYLVNEDGSPNTAHTLNPVPLFLIDKNWHGSLKPGKLGDIAPSILHWMEVPVPDVMSGENLIVQA
jgi:2,3-bisphosphoglycerate-independent phosphoglycerate mutase